MSSAPCPSTPSAGPPQSALFACPFLIVPVTRVLADIGGRCRFAKRLYFEAAISPNEVRFGENRASSSPRIRFRPGSAAGICLIVGQKRKYVVVSCARHARNSI